jgi:hypothetical protein
MNRTAAFVFYVGDRYYGVITTSVPGREASSFSFTRALPVTVVKILAPAINARLKEDFYKQGNSPWLRSLWIHSPSLWTHEYFVVTDNPERVKRAVAGEVREGWLHSATSGIADKAVGLEFASRPTSQLVRGPPA